jgi:hypothetical protein
VEQVEDKAATSAAISPIPKQNNISMIRISFETLTNSDNPEHPEAWRPEASAVLRSIAKRITAGEAMPLILLNRDGNIIGKARELSYRPEPPRNFSAQTS